MKNLLPRHCKSAPRTHLNGDCKVNILDMIEVRNRLGQKCSP